MITTLETYGLPLLILVVTAALLWKSIYSIGPTQVGLVRKRFGAKLPGDNPIAFHGEAGYQAELLMPGLRFKFCLVYAVTKHPWVQVLSEELRSQIGGHALTYASFGLQEKLADKGAQFVPQILVVGGGGALEGLAATLTKAVAGQSGITPRSTTQAKPDAAG